MVIEALAKIQAKEDMTQSNLKQSAGLARAARFIKQSRRSRKFGRKFDLKRFDLEARVGIGLLRGQIRGENAIFHRLVKH
jgi:hypothetical protein